MQHTSHIDDIDFDGVTLVKVYRDDPVWDAYDKPFMLPAAVKIGLFVCAYTIATDDDGDPINPRGCIEAIFGLHPGCVLVF